VEAIQLFSLHDWENEQKKKKEKGGKLNFAEFMGHEREPELLEN